MGNLVRRPNYLLINSVGADDFSHVDGVSMWIRDYGTILTAGVLNAFKCCYCPAILHQELIKVKPKYPCDDCKPDDYGFVIFKDFSLTGRPEEFYGRGKFYGYRIEYPIVSSSGYLDVEDIETVISNIVYQIGNPPINEKQFVYAYERVQLSFTAGTPVLTITDISTGETVTYTALAATIAALVTAINSDSDRLIEVITWNATNIVIEGHSGFGFTTTVSGGLAKDDDYYWIRIKQIEAKKNFTIRQIDGFGTRTVLQTYKAAKVHPDDVARVFPKLPMTDVGNQRDLPIKDGHYCMYKFGIKHDYAYNHSFANHLDEYYEELIMYVLDYSTNIALVDAAISGAGINAIYEDSASCSCSSDSYINSASGSDSDLVPR